MTGCAGEPDLLEARSADFQFLIERNADGVLVLDLDGAVQFANPAAEVTFGRSAAELIGAPIGLPVVAGETTEIAILRPRGGQIDAEMRVVETTWRGLPALLVTVRDISARKAEEERLRQTHKMESIGRLTAGIAHDFNNLLTVVMGNLAILQRQVDPEMASPKLRRASEHAMEAAQRAATLTHRLLAFARRQPLEPRPVEVNRLILGMSDLLQRTLGEAIDIRTDLCEGLLQTLADPNQLESAILNLAVNARDAMPGGGRLLIETRGCDMMEERPDVAPGPYVEIRISDTGVGMAEDVLNQAIEPFFTTKDIGLGTGLGLSQVFGFAKQSGGDVGIESEPGKGTTVTIFMPRTTLSEAEAEAAPDASQVGRELETVLVVDDEDHVRSFSVDALREFGYRVLHANDAASALRLLAAGPAIQLLFTDIGLPGGMNGRELADEARRLRPGLKVLLTSGYAAEALVHGGRLEPGMQLLSKPFSYAALRARVRNALDAPGRAARILIVEDDPMVRLTLVEALADAGCQIEEAATASEALTIFRMRYADLDAAIVDIGLPDGRGDGLVEEFHALRPDLAIVLASGYGDDAARERFADSLRVRILDKPFEGAKLLTVLQGLGVSMAS